MNSAKIDEPVISVIMAVYNEPVKWISEAIDSILNQTFGSFEFIIIDDNPERLENKRLIENYQNEDDRILYIANEENIGLTKSLNKGLDLARGRYVARMDADDISLPERFSRQLDFLEKHPEYVLCGAWVVYFGAKNRMRKFEIDDENIRVDMLYDCPVAHPSVMMNNAILTKYSLRYDVSYRTSQDYAMWFELSKYGKLHNIPMVLVKYRMSGNRVTQKRKNEQLRNAAEIRRKVFDYWMDKLKLPFFPGEKDISSGQALEEFRKFKSLKKRQNKNSENHNDRIMAVIIILLYSSVKENRFKHMLTLATRDLKVGMREPKKFVKALLYLTKARQAKETLV